MLDQLDKLALQLLEAGPEALIVVDANGLICLVNGQAEKLFIYTREELLGQPIEKLLPERSASAHVHMRTQTPARIHTNTFMCSRTAIM